MAQFVNSTKLARAMPLPKLKKIGKNEGEVVKPLDLSFTWKVKGVDTGYAYGMYEMTLAAGKGVPIHVHPFAETFFVLEGRLDVMGINDDGSAEWTTLSKGECANAPSNAPHGVTNRSEQPVTFLSIGNFQHEEAFNSIFATMKVSGADALSDQAQGEEFIRLAGGQQTYFLEVDER